jgi:hypothetical protein
MHPLTIPDYKTLSKQAHSKAYNAHANVDSHRIKSVYGAVFTPQVFLDAELPDRFAALPNNRDLRQRIVAHQVMGNGPINGPKRLPMTSTREYGWTWAGAPKLERFGSTSANHSRAHALGSGLKGLIPATEYRVRK